MTLTEEEKNAILALIDLSKDEFEILKQYFQKSNNTKGLDLAAKFQETIKSLEQKLK